MTPDEARGVLFLHLPRELSPTERMEALLADFMRAEQRSVTSQKPKKPAEHPGVTATSDA